MVRLWRGLIGGRIDASDRRAARVGALLGLVACLGAGAVAAWVAIQPSPFVADSSLPLLAGLVLVWTIPGGVFAGWRLGPGAVRGRRLAWAAARFALLTTVATALFWTPMAVVAFTNSTTTSVSVTGAVTTVGTDIDPARMVLIILTAPFFALFYALYALVLASPIVVPVSLAWAALVRRFGRLGIDAHPSPQPA